jgi:hypothetical protein
MPSTDSGGERRRTLGFTRNDPAVLAMVANQPGENPRQQTSAAHRHHNRIDLGTVLKDFIDHRAVSFPQHRVIEGRHVFGVCSLCEFFGA